MYFTVLLLDLLFGGTAMGHKKYPAVYQQIQDYYTLVAEYHNLLDVAHFIERSTVNAYRVACKLLKEGKYTVEQIIAMYPLD